jgi:dUTP pyrophosphatase
MSLKVKISILDKSQSITLPEYITSGSAGMDVRASLPEPVKIEPSGIVLIPTGIAIALENGYEAQVRSRSGLAIKHGVFALNSPGTVDSDYRGEIKVILANFGKEPFIINNGDRVAQIVVARYERVDWVVCDSLEETERSSGGFGSTGI